MKSDPLPASLIASCLPSDLDLLGVVDWLGPLDAQAIGLALQLPTGAARQTASRLVAIGLLRLDWPGHRRPPTYALTC